MASVVSRVKLSNAVIAALTIAVIVFGLLWRQGRKQIKDAAFEAAAQAATDTAAVLQPLIDAEKARADSAIVEMRAAREQMVIHIEAADSIAFERRVIIASIDTIVVPEDSRRYTEPRDAIIASQQEEIGGLRNALFEANTALAAADTALASRDEALSHAETALRVALDALDQRPGNRWYIPKAILGYGATVSRRAFADDGRIEIHDGLSATVGWELRF